MEEDKDKLQKPDADDDITLLAPEEIKVPLKDIVIKKRRGGRAAESDSPEYIERIVNINRVAKVVKGGKRFGFSALVVVGNGSGKVGAAIGKANDVRSAVEKGIKKAKENLIDVNLTEDMTIPHTVMGKSGAGEILLKPAAPGTGVIAGGPARAVLTAVGVKNVLTKCLRTRNPLNVVYATIEGLSQLQTRKQYAEGRGKKVEEL